jgi:hypothetical protein
VWVNNSRTAYNPRSSPSPCSGSGRNPASRSSLAGDEGNAKIFLELGIEKDPNNTRGQMLAAALKNPKGVEARMLSVALASSGR